MKYIFSNGLKLEVREISEPIFVMERATDVPLPIIPNEIKSDEEAKALLMNLKETGFYTARSMK